MAKQIHFDIEGTPVAIAAMSVAGIVGVCFANVEPQSRTMAIQALGQLAGAAGGVAIPRAIATARKRDDDTWAYAPAQMPNEWSDTDET